LQNVALITLHRSANYGSVLQALATQVVLERMGYDVAVVDYYAPRNSVPEMLRGLRHKKPLFEKNPLALLAARAILLPSYLKRRRTFNRFITLNLRLSGRTYRSNEELAQDPPKADLYVTGSDQVWNSEWNGEALFLAFTQEGAPRISFSASFGKAGLDDGEAGRTRELLARYGGITVREDTGVEIVRGLGLDATQVLDPTLFMTPEDWRPWVSGRRPRGEYILMYNINHNAPLDRFVQRLARKTGLPVYYISYQLHDCFKRGRMRCCVPVEDFLSLIAGARYVVCDSFHCAAFSVNFNREFAIVPPKRFGTRLESFMRVVGLEDRIVGEEDIGIFDRPIDWGSANARLDAERARSLDAVKSAIAASFARCGGPRYRQ
jgi:hypothetical protein